jgi:hypothetical protein
MGTVIAKDNKARYPTSPNTSSVKLKNMNTLRTLILVLLVYFSVQTITIQGDSVYAYTPAQNNGNENVNVHVTSTQTVLVRFYNDLTGTLLHQANFQANVQQTISLHFNFGEQRLLALSTLSTPAAYFSFAVAANCQGIFANEPSACQGNGVCLVDDVCSCGTEPHLLQSGFETPVLTSPNKYKYASQISTAQFAWNYTGYAGVAVPSSFTGAYLTPPQGKQFGFLESNLTTSTSSISQTITFSSNVQKQIFYRAAAVSSLANPIFKVYVDGVVKSQETLNTVEFKNYFTDPFSTLANTHTIKFESSGCTTVMTAPPGPWDTPAPGSGGAPETCIVLIDDIHIVDSASGSQCDTPSPGTTAPPSVQLQLIGELSLNVQGNAASIPAVPSQYYAYKSADATVTIDIKFDASIPTNTEVRSATVSLVIDYLPSPVTLILQLKDQSGVVIGSVPFNVNTVGTVVVDISDVIAILIQQNPGGFSIRKISQIPQVYMSCITSTDNAPAGVSSITSTILLNYADPSLPSATPTTATLTPSPTSSTTVTPTIIPTAPAATTTTSLPTTTSSTTSSPTTTTISVDTTSPTSTYTPTSSATACPTATLPPSQAPAVRGSCPGNPQATVTKGPFTYTVPADKKLSYVYVKTDSTCILVANSGKCYSLAKSNSKHTVHFSGAEGCSCIRKAFFYTASISC